MFKITLTIGPRLQRSSSEQATKWIGCPSGINHHRGVSTPVFKITLTIGPRLQRSSSEQATKWIGCPSGI
ncbi:hypothetical protein CGQ19_25825, partial [Klebsiella quasipneumoniae]